MITPIVLSGGSGTRLWPLSRSNYPKQYLSFNNSAATLFQETILRVTGNIFNKPIIICSDSHRFIVAEQLQLIHTQPEHIVLEAIANNTAPAISTACLLQENLEQLLLILPADHAIGNSANFIRSINFAIEYAQNNYIVTFGIYPNNPDLNYGYIKLGRKLINNPASDLFLYSVDHIVEKPDLITAKSFLNSGKYHWNSGIFLFKTSVMLKELTRLQPDLVAMCKQALIAAQEDLDFLRLDPTISKNIKNISIDHAIMEYTNKAVVMPVDWNWSDLGNYKTLWEVGAKDDNNNVIVGDVITDNVKNSYINSENQLIAVMGIENVIITATQDTILVTAKNHINNITKLVQELKKDNRLEIDNQKKVYRPWGFYQIVEAGSCFKVKKIMVKPGAKLSTQIHRYRSEHWIIIEGIAKVTKGEELLELQVNQHIDLPVGCKHSIENPGSVALYFIEVQLGSYLEEDDIIRIEDLYGRTTI